MISEQASVGSEQFEALGRLHIWRDGRLVGPEEATVPVWDHGFLYGDGVFEGIRLRSGRIYRVGDHLARLRRSSQLVGLTLPFDESALIEAIALVARSNGLTDAHVRVMHTRGVGFPGLDPSRCPNSSVYVFAYPFPPQLGTEPIDLLTSSVVRKAPRSVDPSVKSLNYLDSVLAKLQANAVGAGDAIMLDNEGYVAEATGANVFCVTDGNLRTPPCTAALPGITRRTVLELAEARGMRIAVERLTPGDLHGALEAFLTGSGVGILPIRSIDGRTLASSPGEKTKMLAEAYRETWSDPQYATPIDY